MTADAGSALDVAGIAAVLTGHILHASMNICLCGQWRARQNAGSLAEQHRTHVAEKIAAHVGASMEADRAAAWDECLAAVTSGVASAKRAHADHGHRAIVSALVGLEQAIPRTENPYRTEPTQ